MWADELTVAVFFITAAKHLLNGLPDRLICGVQAQKLLEPVTEDLFEIFKSGSLGVGHPAILAKIHASLLESTT